MSKGRGEMDSLADQIRDSVSLQESNKPDFRELDLGSPVSPLRNTRPVTSRNTLNTTMTATTTTSSSSSSSGGSLYRSRGVTNAVPRLSKSAGNSGELCTSAETSPAAGGRSLVVSARGAVCSQSRSEQLVYSGGGLTGSSCGGFSGSSGSGGGSSAQSSVTSPASINILPAGNICPSGRIVKTGMASRSSKTDVLGSGNGHYGHGSIMRGGSGAGPSCPTVGYSKGISPGGMTNGGAQVSTTCRVGTMDPEELRRFGNDMYKKGHYEDALCYYGKAITLAPANVTYRSNRAAALIGLGKFGEAVKECEEVVRLDPKYWKAHHRLGSLFLRLGQIENAKRHLCIPGQLSDSSELQKLYNVERHITRCADARKICNWINVIKESEAAIVAGADSSPQLIMCKAEALLKLHQLQEAKACLTTLPNIDTYSKSSSQDKIFGMQSEGYIFMVRAQLEMALGKFEGAVSLAEKAAQAGPQNAELAAFLNAVKLVGRARARGNDLFKSDRFTEACAAYGEGLKIDPSNSILYCNRAACWSKLGLWERSVNDCNAALRFQPNYTKALLRRAASNCKLERWSDAVRDYEVLRRELPDDNEIAEGLFHAQVALKKSRGEEVCNMKFGGEVEKITSVEQFKSAISLSGVSVVHFKLSSNAQCKELSPLVDQLCGRYPLINFLQVDIEDLPGVAYLENIRIAPTFKIYKSGTRVKEMVCPSSDMLEHSVRHYSF